MALTETNQRIILEVCRNQRVFITRAVIDTVEDLYKHYLEALHDKQKLCKDINCFEAALKDMESKHNLVLSNCKQQIAAKDQEVTTLKEDLKKIVTTLQNVVAQYDVSTYN